jgi:hypothetical protein
MLVAVPKVDVQQHGNVGCWVRQVESEASDACMHVCIEVESTRGPLDLHRLADNVDQVLRCSYLRWPT